METLEALARVGPVHGIAPVRAEAAIEIAAPKEKVWQILIHASDWPRWNDEIHEVSASGPLALGEPFVWRTGMSTIHSKVQLEEAGSRLAWTGTAYTARAVHVWKLTALNGSHTRVEVDESMDGPMMSALVTSKELTEMCRDWLAALKKAAERP